MSEGEFFRDLMKQNNNRIKAFTDNPEFHQLLVSLFVLANKEAEKQKCNLEDLEVDNPLLTGDSRTVTFSLKQPIKADEMPKLSGLLNAQGRPIEGGFN